MFIKNNRAGPREEGRPGTLIGAADVAGPSAGLRQRPPRSMAHCWTTSFPQKAARRVSGEPFRKVEAFCSWPERNVAQTRTRRARLRDPRPRGSFGDVFTIVQVIVRCCKLIRKREL